MQWLSFIGPVLWTYRQYDRIPDGSERSNESRPLSFEQIVSRSESLKAFEVFLAKEFALENLYFYLHVQQYHAVCKHSQVDRIRRVGQVIFERFIVDSAELSINISSRTRRAIQEAFSLEWSHSSNDYFTVFNQAQFEVVEVLKLHSISRFLQSHEYEELRQGKYSLPSTPSHASSTNRDIEPLSTLGVSLTDETPSLELAQYSGKHDLSSTEFDSGDVPTMVDVKVPGDIPIQNHEGSAARLSIRLNISPLEISPPSKVKRQSFISASSKTEVKIAIDEFTPQQREPIHKFSKSSRQEPETPTTAEEIYVQ